MRTKWPIGLVVLGIVLLLPVMPVLADGDPPDGGATIWGRDFTLGAGESLTGNLVVFSGDVVLEPGSRVEGSVVVWYGDVEVAGTIEEQLVVSGGTVYLQDGASVEEDVVCSWDCNLERESDALVGGEIVEGVPLDGLPFDQFEPLPVPVPSPFSSFVSGTGQAMTWAFNRLRDLFSVLLVVLVAVLVALIWPQEMEEVGQAVAEIPGPSLGVGLLALMAALVLVLGLAFTCCLLPLAILMVIAVGAAGLFGWIGLGAVLGERLLEGLDARYAGPLWAAGAGTALITLVTVLLGWVPCLGGIVGALLWIGLGSLGLGAVLLTRFGSRPYRDTVSRPDSATPEEE